MRHETRWGVKRPIKVIAALVLALAVLGAVVAPSSQAATTPLKVQIQTLLKSLTTTTSTTSTTSTTTTTTAPAVVVAARTAAPSCGGIALAKPSGGPWTCTFDHEFDGTVLDRSKWVVQETSKSGYHSGQECFVDSPDNVSVGGGVLSLTVRKVATPMYCIDQAGGYLSTYTSGMVSTWGLFSQAYGRFEVKAKVPPVALKGLQSSFWLYPQDLKYGPWPGSGEIDIAEVYSQYADRAIPYVHYLDGGADPNVTNNFCYVSDTSKFHTYAVEWTPDSLTFVYDGTTCLVDRWNPAAGQRPQPFDQPFIVCLTQALGIGTNSFDPATTPLPATTQIDYARVWR